MMEVGLALLMFSIALRAFQQVRRDPRFTRKVIVINVIVVLAYFLYGAIGGALLFILARSGEHVRTDDLQILMHIAAFLLWLAVGGIIMARYLKKVIDGSQSRDR
jgi:formate hydrogenlyase subunit 3/multisubunit Na+/H+ antiporter MnhD subunit